MMTDNDGALEHVEKMVNIDWTKVTDAEARSYVDVAERLGHAASEYNTRVMVARTMLVYAVATSAIAIAGLSLGLEPLLVTFLNLIIAGAVALVFEAGARSDMKQVGKCIQEQSELVGRITRRIGDE